MTLPDAQDLAYWRLHDYIDECGILEIRVNLNSDMFYIMLSEDADYNRASALIWRAISRPVEIGQVNKHLLYTPKDSYLCYTNRRWIK